MIPRRARNVPIARERRDRQYACMADRDDVLAIEEHWPVALRDRDTTWLRDHTTEGLVVIEADGSLMDRETYLHHREYENDTIIAGSNIAERVEVIGDAAIVINRAHFLTQDSSGQQTEMLIRGSGLYVRSDGQWRVAAMHLSECSGNRAGWGENLIEVAR
ncbi:MAG: SnoaL-like domain [Acidimicrobiaceae bacterium]